MCGYPLQTYNFWAVVFNIAVYDFWKFRKSPNSLKSCAKFHEYVS